MPEEPEVIDNDDETINPDAEVPEAAPAEADVTEESPAEPEALPEPPKAASKKKAKKAEPEAYSTPEALGLKNVEVEPFAPPGWEDVLLAAPTMDVGPAPLLDCLVTNVTTETKRRSPGIFVVHFKRPDGSSGEARFDSIDGTKVKTGARILLPADA